MRIGSKEVPAYCQKLFGFFNIRLQLLGMTSNRVNAKRTFRSRVIHDNSVWYSLVLVKVIMLYSVADTVLDLPVVLKFVSHERALFFDLCNMLLFLFARNSIESMLSNIKLAL